MAREPVPLEFGIQLRDYRIDRGLNQEQLGNAIGVKQSGISHWELGRKLPDPEVDYVAAIARCLKLTRAERQRLEDSLTLARAHQALQESVPGRRFDPRMVWQLIAISAVVSAAVVVAVFVLQQRAGSSRTPRLVQQGGPRPTQTQMAPGTVGPPPNATQYAAPATPIASQTAPVANQYVPPRVITGVGGPRDALLFTQDLQATAAAPNAIGSVYLLGPTDANHAVTSGTFVVEVRNRDLPTGPLYVFVDGDQVGGPLRPGSQGALGLIAPEGVLGLAIVGDQEGTFPPMRLGSAIEVRDERGTPILSTTLGNH